MLKREKIKKTLKNVIKTFIIPVTCHRRVTQVSKYVSLLDKLAAIQLNRSIQYNQSVNNTMSLIKHHRTITVPY